MTETEVADMLMAIIGLDRSTEGQPITEVEGSTSMNALEIEVELKQRFTITVTEIKDG